MEQPCKGATKNQLIKLFSKRVFYYVPVSKTTCEIKPCILDKENYWHPQKPCVVFFDNDMKLETYRQCVKWEDLFDRWDEANIYVKHINKLFTKSFWKKPYVSVSILEKHKGEMIKIENRIKEGLSDYHNFLGVDFCDVCANGIQIRGYHKAIKNRTYGEQITIKYDFSNSQKVAVEFIEMWKGLDNPDDIENS